MPKPESTKCVDGHTPGPLRIVEYPDVTASTCYWCGAVEPGPYLDDAEVRAVNRSWRPPGEKRSA
jgi:hypothetical protein